MKVDCGYTENYLKERTFDLSTLSSGYSDYLSEQISNQQSTATKNAVSGDYSNATDEELMDACKQFESYFLEQIFKEMEKTIPKDEDSDQSTSSLVDYFKDNVVSKLASDSTETNSLGLAQTLYNQMKRNYDL